jgi:hypothetical protein
MPREGGASSTPRPFFTVIASAAKQSRICPRRQPGLLRCARNDGAGGDVIALQFTSQTADAPSHSRGIVRPRLALRLALTVTRAQGRPGAGWHPSPCAEKMHTGWTTGLAGSPGLPCANGFNGVLRALLGERCTIAPVASRMADARARSGRHITARLDARTPGVRTTRLLRPRTSSHVASSAGVCSRPKPCEDAVSVVSCARRPLLTAKAALQRSIAPDAVASIAPQPAVRDDRDPPLVTGQGDLYVR